MAYQHDLVRGWGPPPPRHHMQSQNAHSEYDNVRLSRRAPDERYYDADPSHRRSRDMPSRSGNPRRLNWLSFEGALNHLFENLKSSLAFYSNFKRDFDNEVHGVLAYADPRLLNDLWTSKVAQHIEDRRGFNTSKEATESQNADNFKTVFIEMRQTFETALDAPPIRRTLKPDKASYGRLMSKIEGGSRDILKMAKDTVNRSDEIGPLMMELELLITYLQKNKTVWKEEGEPKESSNKGGRDEGGRNEAQVQEERDADRRDGCDDVQGDQETSRSGGGW